MGDAPARGLFPVISIRWLGQVGAAALLASCSAARPTPDLRSASSAEGARAALIGFIAAAEADHFDECYRALTGNLRSRYTPERLADDYRAVSAVARERLARARIAADAAATTDGDRVAFPIGAGKAVKLEREDGVWRISSLD